MWRNIFFLAEDESSSAEKALSVIFVSCESEVIPRLVLRAVRRLNGKLESSPLALMNDRSALASRHS